MQHIKTENGWSLYVDTASTSDGLYMIRLLSRFDKSKNPDELREVNKFFFHRGELEQFAAAITRVLDEPAQ